MSACAKSHTECVRLMLRSPLTNYNLVNQVILEAFVHAKCNFPAVSSFGIMPFKPYIVVLICCVLP